MNPHGKIWEVQRVHARGEMGRNFLRIIGVVQQDSTTYRASCAVVKVEGVRNVTP